MWARLFAHVLYEPPRQFASQWLQVLGAQGLVSVKRVRDGTSKQRIVNAKSC
jgi:hypothetical protein